MNDTKQPQEQRTAPERPMRAERSDVDRSSRSSDRNEDRVPAPPSETHPAGSLPPFTDPAFSSRPATPPVRADAPDHTPPPRDTEFAGNPDFSEKAAENEPPRRMGLTESMDEGEGKTGKSEGVNVPLSDNR